MSLLLTRTTAPQAIRLMCSCFKQGVLDACSYGDNIGAKEFVAQKRDDWSFGELGGAEEYDWQMFRNRLYWLARKNKQKSLAESYIFRIRAKNYTWCLLPFCMRFYLMGIEEWLRYPNPVRIELFKADGAKHWDPSEPNKAITKKDIISYLHGFEYEYRSLPAEKKEVAETALAAFIMAVYDLSRKYVTRSEEEDV